MSRVDIKLGYSCNDRCVHCVVDDHRDLVRSQGLRQDKTTEEIQAELSEARARADWVVFTGGEPSIRRDLPHLMRFARDLGYSILVQSNGRRFSRPEWARQVAEAAPAHYCIALHAPCAEIHDAVTGRPGSFAETVQGITNLLSLGQTVTGKVVLSRLNYRVLPDTVQLFLNLGVRHVSIAFPHALGRARKMWDEVVPRYRDVVPYVHRALDVLSAAGATADAETFMYCHMEGYEHFISEIGQQLEEYVELHQYGHGEAENWSVTRWRIKRKFPQCRRCRFDPVCEGPWMEYAEHFGGEEFHPRLGERVQHVSAIVDGSFRKEFAFLDRLPPELA